MSNNIEAKRLCNHASKIKKILGEGYHLVVWPLASGGGNAIFLVPDGKQPHEGVYVCSL